MDIGEFWIGYSPGQGVAIFDTRYLDDQFVFLWMVNENAPKRFDLEIAREHFVSFQPTNETPEQLSDRLTPHFERFRTWRSEAEQEQDDAEDVSVHFLPAPPPTGWRYSYQIDDFHGHPIFEVLLNGQPWSSAWDAHFRFGLTKARMLLTIFDLVELFAITHGQRPRHNSPIIMGRAGLGCIVTCTTFPSFTAYGRFVDEPYIQLETGDTRWGVGLRKAHAVLALEEEIRNFVFQQ